MSSPNYAVPKEGQRGEPCTAAGVDAGGTARTASENPGSTAVGPTPPPVPADRRGRQRALGGGGGRPRGLQRDHGVRVGAPVQREWLLHVRAPAQSAGAATHHHRAPGPGADRHCALQSRRTGPAVLGLDRPQTGRVLPATGGAAAYYRRMGPPAPPPRRPAGPANPDVEDIG